MAKKLNLKSIVGNGNSKQVAMKARLAHYLKLGLTLDEACKLADCSRASLNTLRCDLQFDDFVSRCLAENKAKHLANIDAAGNSGYWQASAWYLERKFPNEFGKKDIVRHEYQIKLQTLQSILVKIINEEISDPQLRFQIANRLRNYEFDGSEAMDHSFKPKLLEDNSNVVDVEE